MTCPSAILAAPELHRKLAEVHEDFFAHRNGEGVRTG
jgi:hypothetical protein